MKKYAFLALLIALGCKPEKIINEVQYPGFTKVNDCNGETLSLELYAEHNIQWYPQEDSYGIRSKDFAIAIPSEILKSNGIWKDEYSNLEFADEVVYQKIDTGVGQEKKLKQSKVLNIQCENSVVTHDPSLPTTVPGAVAGTIARGALSAADNSANYFYVYCPHVPSVVLQVKIKFESEDDDSNLLYQFAVFTKSSTSFLTKVGEADGWYLAQAN